MLKLYYTGNSPYARRARIVVREGGLTHQIEEIVIKDFEQLIPLAPGGKVPLLICEDGTTLAESLIITRYLNELAGGGLVPAESGGLLKMLEVESVASVLMDSLFTRSMEKNMREEALRSDVVLRRESARSRRCYDALNEKVAADEKAPTLASIAVISALGYADWRHPDDAWREGRAPLGAYFDQLMKRAAFVDTAPVIKA